MRALWTGTVSFGLVTIPVRLYAATDDKSVRFNQLRASDHSRIGYQRLAKADDAPVANEEIVKGYEYEPGAYVVFTPDELDALKPESSHTLEIEQFVPLEQIDPIYFARSYYLAPEPQGAKAYGLLARAMEEKDTVAICRITLRDKEHLATLRLRDGVFVLATMHWPDEVRTPDHGQLGLDDVPEPRPNEVAMAEQLIDSLTEDFDPRAYADRYREQILEAAHAKAEGQEVVAPAEAEEHAPVVDLTEALRRSVEAAGRGDRSPATDDDGAADQPAATAGEAAQRTDADAATRRAEKPAKKAAKKASKQAAKKSTKQASEAKRTRKAS